AYGDRFAPPQLLVEMVSAGRLGKKSGQGFYQWKAGVKQ
ncbi:3-hydroxyacyl-CoA dehydrogenase family protein, partial [Streptomyces albogriseolus]